MNAMASMPPPARRDRSDGMSRRRGQPGTRAIGGTATRAAAGQGYRVPGAVAADDIATTATIIVIPPSAE